MPTVDVFNVNREKVGSFDLLDAVFGADVKEHLLYAVVRYQRAAARQGTHKAKERAEVRGGGKKPWRQKGTGRARQGSTRSPQWRGGGVVFGPRVRSHAFKLNRKVRQAALCSALSRRCGESRVIVLDSVTFDAPKTKNVVTLMERFELGDMLLVANPDETVSKSARNLQGVTLLPPEGVNVYDVLRRSCIVVTKDAAEALHARLGS
jgi:large subunit ribosomal protein L4